MPQRSSNEGLRLCGRGVCGIGKAQRAPAAQARHSPVEWYPVLAGRILAQARCRCWHSALPLSHERTGDQARPVALWLAAAEAIYGAEGGGGGGLFGDFL